MTHKVTFY
jgi:CRP-like cAMP-binding protein